MFIYACIISFKYIYKQTYSYLISVVHSHPTAPSRKVKHLPLLLLASIIWGKHHLELTRLFDNKVCSPVL